MDRTVSRRKGWIRGGGLFGVGVLVLAGLGFAQAGPSPAELKRMYDDAIAQLKGAQDRKNELAGENDELKKRLAEVETRLKALETHNLELEREAADHALRTWEHRSLNAAWKTFVGTDAEVKRKWQEYLLGGQAGDARVRGTSDGQVELAERLGQGWPIGQ